MMTTAPNSWSSSFNVPVAMPRLLLADDDRVMRTMLRQALQNNNYDPKVVENGEEAVNLLRTHGDDIDAVILDREMPVMKGLEVVAFMKTDPKLAHIPVIMLTGSGQQEQIQEGIDAGVYYYLVKPVDNTLLRSVIESALRERRQKKALVSELNRYGSALKAMRHCQIMVRTLGEAEDAACFLASCFPNPERVVTGLMELLVNAVEHGNLGISYEEKHKLLAENRWRSELDRLVTLPEYKDRQVEVLYQHKKEGYLVQISDAGRGFDWRRYWHINPARATSGHGRGIVRARLISFDQMAYNDTGNQVTVKVDEAPVGNGGYAW